MTESAGQTEGWELWERRIYALLPYPLLAFSILASVLDERIPRSHLLWLAGVSVLAAGWAWTINPPLGPRRHSTPGSRLAVFQYVVVLGISAVLVGALSTWFGIFAFCNYVFAVALLAGRWRYVGLVANAVVVAASYVDGVPRTRTAVVAFVVLFVIISLLASVFGRFGWTQSEQNARYKRVIVELEESNHRLEAALDENAGLHAQLLVQAREAGVLDERQRMAREIHDTLAQGLAGIVTQLEAADVPNEHVATARQLARESLTEARRSVRGLAPWELAEGRLPTAIADAARRWSATSGIAVTVATTGDPRPLVADVELALFRVCQESLTNVAKHAKATRVGLTLSYMDDVVTLDVRDDGVGFAPDRRPARDDTSGYGLAGMRQRVQRVAGTLEVESAPGEGTAISANVPAITVEV